MARIASWSLEDDARLLSHVAKHGTASGTASSALGCGPGFAAARWATIVLTAAAGPGGARTPWTGWELSIVLQGCQEWAQMTGSDGRQQLQGQLYDMLARVLPGRSACAIRHIAKEQLGGNLKQQQRRMQHFLRAVPAPDDFDQLLLMWAKFLRQQMNWGTAQQQQALAAQMLEQLQHNKAESGLDAGAAAGADRPVQLDDVLFRASDATPWELLPASPAGAAAGAGAAAAAAGPQQGLLNHFPSQHKELLQPWQPQCQKTQPQKQQQLQLRHWVQPGSGSGPDSPTATGRGQGWLPDCGAAGRPLAVHHSKSGSPPLQQQQQQQQQWELCACACREPSCPLDGSCKRRRHSVDGAGRSVSRYLAAAEAALASQQLSQRLQAVQAVLFNTAAVTAAASGSAAAPAASGPCPSAAQTPTRLGVGCDAAAAAGRPPAVREPGGDAVDEHQQALAAALQHVESVQQQLQNRLSALECAIQQEAELAAGQQLLLQLQPQQPPSQALGSFTTSSGCSMAGAQQACQQQQQALPQAPAAAGTPSPVLLQQHPLLLELEWQRLQQQQQQQQQQHLQQQQRLGLLAGQDSGMVVHAGAAAHTPATPDSNHSSPPAPASLAACVPPLAGATTTAVTASWPPPSCGLLATGGPAGDTSGLLSLLAGQCDVTDPAQPAASSTTNAHQAWRDDSRSSSSGASRRRHDACEQGTAAAGRCSAASSVAGAACAQPEATPAAVAAAASCPALPEPGGDDRAAAAAVAAAAAADDISLLFTQPFGQDPFEELMLDVVLGGVADGCDEMLLD